LISSSGAYDKDVLRKSYYGSGYLPIVASDTYCTGFEPQIYNCTGLHPAIGAVDTSCNYGSLAGVKCLCAEYGIRCLGKCAFVQNNIMV
jgi:hypothetical protein